MLSTFGIVDASARFSYGANVGYGLFETMAAANGKVLRLDRHLALRAILRAELDERRLSRGQERDDGPRRVSWDDLRQDLARRDHRARRGEQ